MIKLNAIMLQIFLFTVYLLFILAGAAICTAFAIYFLSVLHHA